MYHIATGWLWLALLCHICIADSPQGSLDACPSDGTMIAGWASDPDFNGPISVHVYVDGQIVKALVAQDYRPDIGAHGFNWIPPPYGQGTHSIVVYAIGVDSQGVPDGNNPAVEHCPCSISAGCARLQGDALVWCEGLPSYWQTRQKDTVMVGNNQVRVGVNTAFGGTVFQLYNADWQTNLIDEHGGGAHQLSIWGYDPKGPDAWFREPTKPLSCDPTPYPTQDSCTAGGNTCALRCCSAGSHVLDCQTHFPCGGWTAGAPWNPIQAMGQSCGWASQYPLSAANWSTPTEFYTSLDNVWHFTSNLPAAPLRMEQWIAVDAQLPYARARFRMTFQGGPPAWITTTQEIPAIFTANGMSAVYYWYSGGAPWSQAPVTRQAGPINSFLRFPNRTFYPHPNTVGNVTESWWGVCDAAEQRCLTLACFDPACVEASVADNGDGSGYITPIGWFGVTPGMDLRWSLYLFPYRWDAVVQGRSVRTWIQALAQSHIPEAAPTLQQVDGVSTNISVSKVRGLDSRLHR